MNKPSGFLNISSRAVETQDQEIGDLAEDIGEEGMEEEDVVEAPQAHANNLMTSGGSRRGIRCHVCNKIFKRSNHLTQHMRMHTAEKNHFCTECSKSFSSALVLKNHMRTHNTGNKSYTCDFCNASFNTISSLRRHAVMHTIKVYPCSHCNEQFRTALQLRKHIKECGGKIKQHYYSFVFFFQSRSPVSL